MVYESDFYTTRRPYRASPSLSTYTVTSPRYYTVRDSPDRARRSAEQQYSYSYQSTNESRSADPYTRPQVRSYTTSERVNRSSEGGPGGYTYSTERSTRNYGDGPGGYNSSYSSTTSGRLPGGTSYRHYSYRSSVPSRQVRILPGLGKVHVVHTYDRIVPYVGHKRLTVVTSNPLIYRTRPSVLYREYDRIENKYRPITYYSAVNSYLNSDAATRYLLRRPLYDSIYYPYYHYFPYLYRSRYSNWYSSIFDDETRLIRAQSASLLKRIHTPVPRVPRALPLPYLSRYDYHPYSRITSDDYIYRMLMSSPKNRNVVQYTTYYTEPVRKYFGQGHLSCVSYAGDKSHPRRRNVYVYEDPVRNDIQLLSYYISKFRENKVKELPSTAQLPANRPSRKFASAKSLEDTGKKEMEEFRDARAARLANIYEIQDEPVRKPDDGAKKKAEEAKAAEARNRADESAKKEAQARKNEAAKKAEIARQEELAAKAAAERAAELERQAEQAKQEELAKQAEIEQARKDAEEKARLEEERKAAELAKAEEERLQLLRLDEIARQAEEEREAELARQAEELAELARVEAELAEQKRKEAEEEEERKRLEDLVELERQEAELAELERQEKELAELAKQESELAEQASNVAEQAKKEAEEAEEAATEEGGWVGAEEETGARKQSIIEEDPIDDVAAAEAPETIEEDVPVDEADVEGPVVEEPDTPEAAGDVTVTDGEGFFGDDEE